MRIGEQAPGFDLTDISGEKISLDGLNEYKAVAVIFGCNHCPYVKAYVGRIIATQAKYRDKGYTAVMINSNNENTHPDDSFDNMKKNASENGFNFPYLRDETAEVARAYEAKYTPEVFLLDSERKLRYKGRIDDCWHSVKGVKRHDLEKALEEILDGKEVGVKSTTPVGCTIKWP
jgi:peroxiredoxin